MEIIEFGKQCWPVSPDLLWTIINDYEIYSQYTVTFLVTCFYIIQFNFENLSPSPKEFQQVEYFGVKSVQSTLSHLQSPPEQMQSQRNYDSFFSKSHLHRMILFTMSAQNRPKSKRQCFYYSNLLFQDCQYETEGSNCDMFGIKWQVLILKAVLH